MSDTPDLPDVVDHTEDLEGDDGYAAGDDEHLASVDLSRLGELAEQMTEVGDDKDAARDWYARLDESETH